MSTFRDQFYEVDGLKKQPYQVQVALKNKVKLRFSQVQGIVIRRMIELI